MAFDLLPEKRAYIENYKVDGACILLALILPFCSIIAIYIYLLQQQSEMQEKIQTYREEQQSLAAIHESDDSIRAADVSLRATRKFWQLLDDVINPSVCLSEMHRSKNKIIIVGHSQSTQHLKIFADKLSASQSLTKVTINKLIITKNQHVLEFNIHADEQVR